MAVQDRVISAFTRANTASANDLILIVINANTANSNNRAISFGNLFANIAWTIGGSFSINTSNAITANVINISFAQTPANSTSLGLTTRSMWFDEDFIYTCSNNIVKRVSRGSTF